MLSDPKPNPVPPHRVSHRDDEAALYKAFDEVKRSRLAPSINNKVMCELASQRDLRFKIVEYAWLSVLRGHVPGL